MAAPTRITMPRRWTGQRLPDRYLCDRAHAHPNRQTAVRCNQKLRAKEAR